MADDLMESADDAARLDRLLAAAPMPAVPVALERHIMAEFDRRYLRWSLGAALRRTIDAVWPGGPAWQPAFAFSLALLIGLGIAAFAPFDIPQQDDAGSSAFALDGSPDLDAGQGI